MFEQTFTAKTVEEAVQLGLKTMNVKENQVKIDVIQQGKKGLFGFGQQDATVNLIIIDPELKKKIAENGLIDEAEAEPEVEHIVVNEIVEDSIPVETISTQANDEDLNQSIKSDEDIAQSADETIKVTAESNDNPAVQKESSKMRLIESAEKTESYILSIIKEMGIEATGEHWIEGNEVTIELFSNDAARIIGKRGQTLNALQTLALNYLQHIQKGYCIVTLDIEDYRRKRQETLETLALNMSKKALATKEPVKFEPMPNYERKVMHQILSNIENIETYSEGRDPHRYLVIKAK